MHLGVLQFLHIMSLELASLYGSLQIDEWCRLDAKAAMFLVLLKNDWETIKGIVEAWCLINIAYSSITSLPKI